MNKLSKLLLATSCLTAINVVPAVTHAVSETEPNDTLATANVMPVGTTLITGTSPVGGTAAADDNADFFKLTGLQPGGAFDVTGTVIVGCPGCFEVGFLAANNSGGTIVPEKPLVAGTPQHLTGTIPSDGILVLDVVGFWFEGGTVDFTYRLDVSAPPAVATPEPSVLSLVAAGAAGLGVLGGLLKKRRTR